MDLPDLNGVEKVRFPMKLTIKKAEEILCGDALLVASTFLTKKYEVFICNQSTKPRIEDENERSFLEFEELHLSVKGIKP